MGRPTFIVIWFSVQSLLVPLSTQAAHRTLEIRVDPRTCHTPCEIRIIARVEPHPDNRRVVISVDGIAYFSATELTVDGDQSPPTFPPHWFKGIPPGNYDVSAVLLQIGDVIAARVRVTVLVE